MGRRVRVLFILRCGQYELSNLKNPFCGKKIPSVHVGGVEWPEYGLPRASLNFCHTVSRV